MMHRRHFVASVAAGVSAAGLAHATVQPGAPAPTPAPGSGPAAGGLKGRINHSVCRWCYNGTPLDALCAAAADMGLKSVELLNEDEWPVAQKHGLTCAVAANVKSNPIHKGFNRVENHDQIIKDLEDRLPKVKAAGLPNQIVFSGNRDGLSDAEGLKNCAKGLKRIVPTAEALGVTIIMELLNSKVDHRDYQCDRTPWGAALVDEVGSDRFKLLYDIYHMQIMEGDVCRTIVDHKKHIGHYHTGGVPGRNEIDETQELFYPRVMQAILETGFTGYVAQEFIPRREPLASLRQGVMICDV